MLKSLFYAGCLTGLLAFSIVCTAATVKKHTWEDGSTYEGEWAQDQPHGYGTLTLVSGARYTGMFNLGFPHGKGEYRYANGDVYIGQWKDGQHHGKGTLLYKNGSRYKGDFAKGERHGDGELTMVTGLTFKGPFVHDMAHGAGTCSKNSQSQPCEYQRGKLHEQKASQSVATNNYRPPMMLPAQTNARVAILDVNRLTKEQLEGRTHRIPGTKSISDLNQSRSDIFFVSHGVGIDLFAETPLAWWQKRPSIFGNVLDLLAIFDQTEVHFIIEDYKGPGDYTISNVKISSPTESLQVDSIVNADITIESEKKGWVSGYFQLTLYNKNGKEVRMDHGVFRVNDKAPSPRF